MQCFVIFDQSYRGEIKFSVYKGSSSASTYMFYFSLSYLSEFHAASSVDAEKQRKLLITQCEEKNSSK